MLSNTFPNADRLFDLIQARLALSLNEYQREDVLDVAEALIAVGEAPDFDGLLQQLAEQPITVLIWQKLIRIMTVAETYFFRDLNQIAALRYSVLPELIEQRRAEGQLELRLWSAGCSTGEEPYTLAILLRDLLPDFSRWNITILATDLNLNHLERAKRGVFRPWSFRAETPFDVRERWFADEQTTYRIDPSIQAMVVFLPLNLASDDYPSFTNGTMEMDVILCRNVLIYFDNATTAATIGRFRQALRPQGWLVLGHSETAHVPQQDFIPQNFEKAVLYQKRQLPEPPRPSTAVAETMALSQPPHHSQSTAPPAASPRDGAASVPDPLLQARQATDREQWQEALRYLAQAEQHHRLSPEVHYLRGVIALKQNDELTAMESMRRAIYCDGNCVLAHFTLGEVYEKQGKYRKAAYEWALAGTLLERLPPEAAVPYNDELTVETLSQLVQSRLANLPNQS